jgi:PilZ domain
MPTIQPATPLRRNPLPFPMQNRRAEARIACRFMAHVARQSGDTDEHWALLKNTSATGIGFLTWAEFPVGELLTVQVYGQEHRAVLVVQVRHTRQEAKGWFYGCKVVARSGAVRRDVRGCEPAPVCV